MIKNDNCYMHNSVTDKNVHFNTGTQNQFQTTVNK